jgi:arginase family enzyme
VRPTYPTTRSPKRVGHAPEAPTSPTERSVGSQAGRAALWAVLANMATLDAAAEGVCRVIQRGNVPILLGGDDSLLLAGARGVHDAVDGSVAIAHFDAHLDLMDESVRQGRFSHSSGMRRALELGRVSIEHSIQLSPRHFNYPMSLGQLGVTREVGKGDEGRIHFWSHKTVNGCEPPTQWRGAGEP